MLEKSTFQGVPKLAGTNEWTTSRHSIRELLSGRSFAHFVLCFYNNSEKLPDIGLTTFPVKELFWELAKENTSPEDCEFILKHKWNDKDFKYWNELVPGCAFPIDIFILISKEEPNKVKIMFGHNGIKSSIYKFTMCPILQDAYLFFFTPFDKFPSKENTKNQISFLNPKDYLFEYSNRIKEGILSKKTNWEFSLCVGCCNNTADIVIIPCGHTVFCSRCETKWKDKCPYCKSELGLDLKFSRCKSRLPSKQCLVCPKYFECHKMDCMLFPCGCIIGCCLYAEKAIVPSEGGKCPNCNEEVSSLQKVFIQQDACS